jgi:hypothetical protein
MRARLNFNREFVEPRTKLPNTQGVAHLIPRILLPGYTTHEAASLILEKKNVYVKCSLEIEEDEYTWMQEAGSLPTTFYI